MTLADELLETARNSADLAVEIGAHRFATILVVGSTRARGRRPSVVMIGVRGCRGPLPGAGEERERLLNSVFQQIRDVSASAAVLIGEVEPADGSPEDGGHLGAFIIEPSGVRVELAPIERRNGRVVSLGAFRCDTSSVQDASLMRLSAAVAS